MPSSQGALFKGQFTFLLLALAAIAGSLFMVFIYVASSTFSELVGTLLFLLVTGLLIGGYMLGFMALAFVGILLLTKCLVTSSKQPVT